MAEKIFAVVFGCLLVALVIAGWKLHVSACQLHINAVARVRDPAVREKFQHSWIYSECAAIT